MIRYQVNTPDEQIRAEARKRWDAVAKPLHSLGALETLITQIAAITGHVDPSIDRRCVLVFCADNGVVCEGVSQSGPEVTALVANAIADGTSNVNLMAAPARADVYCIDMGMAEKVSHPALLDAAVSAGTSNMAKGPAMTRRQAEQAIQTGIDLIGKMKEKGYQAVAVGEMGIGNTTTTAAVTSALLSIPPHTVTGRGAGLSDTALHTKIHVIQRALCVNQPDPADPIDVLRKVGGYDIAAMCGACLGGMTYGMPILLDGVISACAALCAARICANSVQYLLASHSSREPASARIFDELQLKPVIQAQLSLGEGTGAVLLFPMLDAALNVYRSCHTFEGLGMQAYTEPEEKK